MNQYEWTVLRWFQVDIPTKYCCAFAINESDIIMVSAPIMRWAVGRSVHEYAAWARKQGAKFTKIKR